MENSSLETNKNERIVVPKQNYDHYGFLNQCLHLHIYDPVVHAERTQCRFVLLSLENDFSFGFRNRLGKRPCYAIHIVSVAF